MELNKEEKEKLKNFLEEYLELKGVNTRKLFRCLSKDHEDKNPSMNYFPPAKICKCFGCGKTYNIFQLVGEEYGIQNYKEQVIKTKELYENRELIKNVNDSFYSKKGTFVTLINEYTSNTKKQNSEKEYTIDQRKKYTDYIKKCEENLKLTNYLENRGISKDIQKEYHIGFDPHFKNGDWQAIIIPTDYCCFTARNIDVTSKDRLRKVGHSAIFNYWELKVEENRDKNFFIVEGEIDALSVISAGQKAIALGSTSNINILLEHFQKDNPSNEFFLMLDNDEAGKVAETELYKKLKEININVIKVPQNFLENYKNYKDPNDFLVKNKDEFKKTINSIVENCKYNIRENKKSIMNTIKKRVKKKEENER